MNDNEKYIQEFVKDIPFDAPNEKHRHELKKQLLNSFPRHRLQPTVHTVRIRRMIINTPLVKLAAAAALIISMFFGLDFLGGPDMATVTWGKIVENVEHIEWFIFRQRVSVEIKGDPNVPEGTTMDTELITYISSEYGLRQEAYTNGQVAGISFIPPAGKIITQVMPGIKKYRIVTTTEEHVRRTHEQANPVGMIKEFMSYEYTKLGRDTVDGVEVEGIEVSDPRFLHRVFESTVGRLWVDVETDLPVRTEIEGITGGGSIQTKIVAYDFDWDVELEPDIFEPNVPDDYTLLDK